jgi:uncharacterized membrane protein
VTFRVLRLLVERSQLLKLNMRSQNMNTSANTFKANIVYGLILVVPLGVIILLIAKIVEILEKIAKPLGLQSATSAMVGIILALMVFAVFCYAVGAVVRSQMVQLSYEKFEGKILRQIPGFVIVSNVLKGFAEKKTAYPAALVRLYGPGTAVLGFVMEENANDTMTVFVPAVPAITVGSLHIVDRERVTILETGAMDVTECISQWGVGSTSVLRETKT